MSRDIARRVIVKGKLFCVTPLHVGAVDSRPGSDLPLAVNGRGKFYIPGTSLAGPLRAWCAEVFARKEVEELWGPEDADEGHASHVIVEDAVIEDGKVAAELRDHVSIDRFSGSAKKGAKFDREILPAGTELSLCLIFEEKRDDTRGAEILASLLQTLIDGEEEAVFWLGAARSRGLGRVKLTHAEVTEQKVGSRDGILSLLRGQAKPSGGLEALCPTWKEHRRTRPLIKIRIGWRPNGPMMVKAGADGRVVNSLPLLSKKQGQSHLALPGSSSKGALRSQAERIVATLYDGKDEEATRRGEALIAALFGAPNSPSSEKAGEKDWLPGLSALVVQDCFSNEVMDGDTLQHMLAGGDSSKDLPKWTDDLKQHKKNRGGKPYLDPVTHVAIDRWTGGASDKALFKVLEPWAFTWEELILTICPNRLPGAAGNGKIETGEALAAIALLLLTLADFVKGEIPLGFGINRGFGTVTAESVTIDLPGLKSSPEGLPKVVAALAGLEAKAEDGKLALGGATAVAALREAWTGYLQPPETTAAAIEGAPA